VPLRWVLKIKRDWLLCGLNGYSSPLVGDFSAPNGYLLLGFLYPFTFIPQLIVSKNKAYSMHIKV